MTTGWSVLAAIGVAWALAYWRASLMVWTAAIAAGLAAYGYFADLGRGTTATLWAAYVLIAAVFNIAPLRRAVITRPVFRWFRHALPQVSQTEQEALDAGTVW